LTCRIEGFEADCSGLLPLDVESNICSLKEQVILLIFFMANFSLFYRAFHGFEQAKFAYGGSILGSSQFPLLSQMPLKTMLDLKVVKINN